MKPDTLKKLGCAVLAATMLLSFALTSPIPATADEVPTVLIDVHHEWQYEDSDTDLFGDIATDFRSPDFDAAEWQTGPSPLGYPATESDKATFGAINAGGTLMNNRTNPNAILTYYLRTYFVADDVADISALKGELSFDDGYALYLNGHLIDSMYLDNPSMAGHTTDANYVNEASSAEGKRTVDLTAYTVYLNEGQNVLAVSLHNRDKNSSDIYWGLKLSAVYEEAPVPADGDLTPRQVNAHVGNDAATEVTISYTTIKSAPSIVTLTDGTDTFEFDGTSSVGVADKYFHKIPVSGLSPDTTYEYVVGEAPNTFTGKFKTMPAKGSQDSFKFVYLADTQPSDPIRDGEALGATMTLVSELDPDFVYLAGDITDTSTSEPQWESLFNNGGLFPTGGQDMFGNYLIAAVQGNHDNDYFTSHFNTPSQEGKIVYSFDYGPMTFILLNLETARNDAVARGKQLEFLKSAVAEAKERGQWTAVGFHKSLYTGASHITDNDVIAARTFWCPEFAKLDVDFVLQGHDHVYSRGFVLEDGSGADVDAPKGATVQDPANAPLYMIGGHAGGLKWYSMKNYTVTSGDPLTLGYSFLDVNSANPADNAEFANTNGSDVKKEQVVVEFSVEQDEVNINTYMFKYDDVTDSIQTPKYLFDSLTVQRDVAPATESASLNGPASVDVKSRDEIVYTVNYNNLDNANAFITSISYDNQLLQFVRAESAVAGTVFSDTKTKGETVTFTNGAPVGLSGNQEVARFVFKLRSNKVTAGDTATVTLTGAETVQGTEKADVLPEIDSATASVATSIVTVIEPGDANGDGKFTLADLALALEKYQTNDSACDANGDGLVDAADLIIIYNKILAAK